jgi:hypothetical protein
VSIRCRPSFDIFRRQRGPYAQPASQQSEQPKNNPNQTHTTRDKTQRKEKSLLNASGRQHLLPQVVLVLGDGARPLVHRPVLTHKDVLGNLVKQSAAHN